MTFTRTAIGTLLAVVVLVLPAGLVSAEGWGNLKLQLLYDGVPPKPKPEDLTKDAAYCGKFNLVAQELVVDPESKGVANVVVFVRSKGVPVHPELEKQLADPVLMDNKGCRFEPRVTLLWNKRTLHIKNTDKVGHNTAITNFRNESINPLIPTGATFKQEFPLAESRPSKVTCSIHRWMTGWILIADSPYTAVSGKTGIVELKNLPAGELEFQIWHELVGYVSKVSVAGTPTEWVRGRPKLTIENGKTLDLGKVLIAPAEFEDD